jgi:hypothetical protein
MQPSEYLFASCNYALVKVFRFDFVAEYGTVESQVPGGTKC